LTHSTSIGRVAHSAEGACLGGESRSLVIDRSGGRSIAVTVTPLSVGPSAGGSQGQTLAEYALILSLIAILAVLALLFLGGAIAEQLSSIGRQI
jgi:Flp pilus assembly pilin Flp